MGASDREEGDDGGRVNGDVVGRALAGVGILLFLFALLMVVTNAQC